MKIDLESSHYLEAYPTTHYNYTFPESYEEIDMKPYGQYTSLQKYKVEYMSIDTGEIFFLAQDSFCSLFFPTMTSCPNDHMVKMSRLKTMNLAKTECRRIFTSDCIITRTEGGWSSEYIHNTSLEDYKNKQATKLANDRKEREIEEEQMRQHFASLEQQRKIEKERMIAELRERCASYGFSGDENIAACVQREAQHDLELAQQERALRLAQQRLANQSRQTQVQSQVVEEEVPWWLQFLADVAIGVAEGYEQNAIHNSQHKNEKKDIFRDCRPNC